MTQGLAQWVTLVKSSLRGSTRGVLYHNSCGKWCRLQALLDDLAEVSIAQDCMLLVWRLQHVLRALELPCACWLSCHKTSEGGQDRQP